MNKKILLLGASGMLGGSLLRYFTERPGYDVVASVRSIQAKQSLKFNGNAKIITVLDVLDRVALDALILNESPDYIFNCIGVIKQLAESKHHTYSIQINSLLPHQIAETASEIDAKLIHFSTDCVFSGSKGNYLESDIPDAMDLYGKSKLLGEVGYGGHLTLRTSIIGHENTSCHSLVDWFLTQKSSVSGFKKAIFSGVPTIYMAEIIEQCVFTNPDVSGVYHLSVDPINKFDLLQLIKYQYNKNITIESEEDFIIDRSLNSNKFRNRTGFSGLQWKLLIEKMHNEYEQYFNC